MTHLPRALLALLLLPSGCDRLLPFGPEPPRRDAVADSPAVLPVDLALEVPSQDRPRSEERRSDQAQHDLPRAGDAGCGAGLTACGGVCVNVKTSATDCGGCGIKCASGLDCVNGACLCKPGGLCMGCCYNNVCLPGGGDGACGSGGVGCQVCNADPCKPGHCTPQRICAYAASLPDGALCMNGAGKCRAGACCQSCWDGTQCRSTLQQDADSCGLGGSTCESCGPNPDPCQVWTCLGGMCALISLGENAYCNAGAGICHKDKCCLGCWLPSLGICVPTSSQSGSACGNKGANCSQCVTGLCIAGVCL